MHFVALGRRIIKIREDYDMVLVDLAASSMVGANQHSAILEAANREATNRLVANPVVWPQRRTREQGRL